MMLSLSMPSDETIQNLLDHQSHLPCYQRPEGIAWGERISGYHFSCRTVHLGKGKLIYEQAQQAIRSWAMFPSQITEVFPRDASINVGTEVVIRIRYCRCWALGICRIAQTFDEDGEISRFGFSNATLPAHLEKGEERFLVTWNRQNDHVCYELSSYSKPNHLLAWLGYPVVRLGQRRFATLSLAHMKKTTDQYANKPTKQTIFNEN